MQWLWLCLFNEFQIKVTVEYSHQIWHLLERWTFADQGTESHSIAPRGCHVINSHIFVTFNHSTTPKLQCLRSTSLAHLQIHKKRRKQVLIQLRWCPANESVLKKLFCINSCCSFYLTSFSISLSLFSHLSRNLSEAISKGAVDNVRQAVSFIFFLSFILLRSNRSGWHSIYGWVANRQVIRDGVWGVKKVAWSE